MSFLLGLFLSIVADIISGVFGMMAWNMCIPVIFVGAPKITIIQSIILAVLLSIMTNNGAVSEDKTITKDLVETEIIKIFIIIVTSSIWLGILWLLMQIAY